MLDGPLLKYYKSSESSDGRQSGQPGQLELKGSVTLPDCEVDVLPAAEAGGRQHAFQLTPASRKIFIICAPDAASRDAWIGAIRRNAAMRFDGPQEQRGGGAGRLPTPLLQAFSEACL